MLVKKQHFKLGLYYHKTQRKCIRAYAKHNKPSNEKIAND